MLRYLLWDNDGVLVDSERCYFEAGRQVLAEHGVELTEEIFAEISLRRGAGIFELVPHLDAWPLRLQRNALYDAMLAAADDLVIPGVRDVLAELGARYEMAIVTSSNPDHFATIHGKSGLLEHFAFALTNVDYPATKPEPDGYLAAMARFGAEPGECLVIEDTPRGLAAARAAGVDCVVIPNRLARDANWSGACAVLATISELPGYLASRNSDS